MASLYRASIIACVAATGLGLAGCANEGSMSGLFPTSSIGGSTETVAAVMAPKIDPACTTLAGQIDGLRREGTIDRLEKVADGKGAKLYAAYQRGSAGYDVRNFAGIVRGLYEARAALV